MTVSGYAISVTSYGISPSTVNKGDRVKIFLNLDSSLPSAYDIRISGSSSGSGASKLGHGQKYWYSYLTTKKTGSFKIYFHLFKNGQHAGYLNKYARFTVNAPVSNPTVSSVSFPRLTKDVRSGRITINGRNLTSRIAFTISDAENCTVSYSNSSRVYAYCTPRASGSKSWIVKDRSGGTALKRGTVTVNAPVSNPTVSSVSIPTLTKDKESKITFSGRNFITGMAFTIYDADCRNNNIVTKTSSTQAYIYCTPRASGSKRWVIKKKSQGTELKSGTVTVAGTTPDNAAILSLLNRDSLVKNMHLSSHLNDHLSRSDMVILVDKMKVHVKNGAEKNMEAYYNPFADVPGNAEYLPSLTRLAYYKSKSFGINPIEKYNDLFNPMHHATREEFLKVALIGLDIPRKSHSLSAFSDRTQMSSWATKYFETAVADGIIVGNNGKLLARDKISIQEALWILERIRAKYNGNYPFDINSYDSPESLDISRLYHKNIGFEYEPRYYKADATPISIASISKSKTGNYYVLTVNATIDTAKGASAYYWWSTDKGYFKEETGSSNYRKVRFYPLSTKPNTAYHIVVNGGDNLGYVDNYALTINTSDFTYTEDTKAVASNQISANLNSISASNNLVSGKLFTVDLSSVYVKKTGIELGVDQVDVKMTYGNKTYTLFHGTPTGKKARFIVPDYNDLYDKNVSIKVEAYSQAKKLGSPKVFSRKYIPQFTIRGKVYNATSGTKVTSLMLDGQKRITLDENGEFYYTIDRTSEIHGMELKTKQNSAENHFDTQSLDLTYASPNKYIVLTGEDSRVSPNIIVSPIHVPSNESVEFTLKSDSVIPANATVSLENSSCSAPSGLGSKQVTVRCQTTNTTAIVHSIMSIESPSIYAGSIVRTVVVDKSLNSQTDIETVKSQLYVPTYTTENIFLPTRMLDVAISWQSSDASVIGTTGQVIQKSVDKQVTLTATLRMTGVVDSKIFAVTVPASYSVNDLDGDGISDANDPDIDGDGVVNMQDIFPYDKNEWIDHDNDGIGDNADSDDDNDGVLDNNDDLPYNPRESVDTDGDGTGNNADKDDDNDGISDADERRWGFDPLDASDGGTADADGDGVSNADEIEAGSDPLDPDDTKKPKRYVPIISDDMVIMVPMR